MEQTTLGYPAVSKSQFAKLFPGKSVDSKHTSEKENIQRQLTSKTPALTWDSFSTKGYQERDFWIPDLVGANIMEHYDNIARIGMGDLYDQIVEFQKFALNFSKVKQNIGNGQNPLPVPTIKPWAGWVRYDYDQNKPQRVPYPSEQVLVLDTETFVKCPITSYSGGPPVMASGMSTEAFYMWIHPALVEAGTEFDARLIPLNPNKPTVGIMHNSAFDVQRFDQSTRFDKPNLYAICTQSMHQNVSGLTSHQRMWFNTKKKTYTPRWAMFGSPNSLVDTYNFHVFPQESLSKESKAIRNIFRDALSIDKFITNLSNLLIYALNDAIYTTELFGHLFPKFREAAPNFASLWGMMQISTSVVPVADNWDEWRHNTDKIWDDNYNRASELLGKIADDIFQEYLNGNLDINSPPLNQLDWSVEDRVKNWKITCVELATRKNGKVYQKKLDTRTYAVPKYPELFGVPKWYVQRVKSGQPLYVGVKTELAHILLALQWHGKPVWKDKKMGYVYEDQGTITKVPHPSGKDDNVGSLLSQDFVKDFEDGILSSPIPTAREVMLIARENSYWTSARARVHNRHIEKITNPLDSENEFSLLLPNVVPSNTFSSRTGEEWALTIPATDKNKIGTETKTQIRAPYKYVNVRFDFSGQEAVIGSLYGDTLHKLAGSTATGYGLIAGSKERGDDYHTQTANMVGIGRGTAKGVNYCLLFGGGLQTTTFTIWKGAKTMGMSKAKSLAKSLIQQKKGIKDRNTRKYHGGVDSHMYNVMYDLINKRRPTEPCLGRAMSSACTANAVGNDFVTSRVNWTIQSCAASMLHAVLTGIQYLADTCDIVWRFTISIHDEVAFMVKAEDAKLFAFLLNIAHAWSWTAIHHNLGIYEMPYNRAWPEGVDIDSCLRKSVKSPSRTRSNPIDIEPGTEYTMKSLYVQSHRAKKRYEAGLIVI